jgi:hypothetical protein
MLVSEASEGVDATCRSAPGPRHRVANPAPSIAHVSIGPDCLYSEAEWGQGRRRGFRDLPALARRIAFRHLYGDPKTSDQTDRASPPKDPQ